MKMRLEAPPLAWVDETWEEGVNCAFTSAALAFQDAQGPLPPAVTVTLGGYVVALSFPLIEALGRLAAKVDGYDVAHLTQMDNGDVLEVGRLPDRLPPAFDVIEGGRA